MPNWCDNQLTVYGPEKDLARFKKQAVGYDPDMTAEERACEKPCGLNFHSLVPIPDKVIKAGDPSVYKWQIANWGVKWGASWTGEPSAVECLVSKGKPKSLYYSFDTPWVPPIKFLKNVSKKWPTLLFLLDCTGDGLEFIGVARAKAGKVDGGQIDTADI